MKDPILFVFRFIWDVIVKFYKDNVLNYCGSIGFFTIFSMPGVLVFVVLMVSLVFDQAAVTGELYLQIKNLVGHNSAMQAENIITNVTKADYTFLAAIIGFSTLSFGATSVFISIQDGLDVILGVRPRPRKFALKFILNRLLSFAMIASIGFLLLVSLSIDVTLIFFEQLLQSFTTDLAVVVMKWFHIGFSFVVIFFVFALIYKVLPHATMRWTDAFFGAAIATILFMLGKWLIGIYLGNSILGNAYGTAGSLVLLLVWIYYSSIILLFAAVCIFQFVEVQGRKIMPSQESVKVITTEITSE